MHNPHKRRNLSILLVLALLIVAVAVIVPIMTSADPAEIDDFGYQTLSALNLANDVKTDLRFVFTVGKLDYTEVGFVISKSNSTPTIGGANCYKAGTDTVYSAIMANGVPQSAGVGRYWVAVKLTDIPHAYFDGSFYLCAFVTDGEGTRYSDVASFTVCSIKGHTHTIDETAHDMVGGTAALNREGTKIGHCDGCNLDNVTQYNATTAFEYQKWTGGSSTHAYRDGWDLYTEVLKNGTLHFYPDESNSGQGNDLLIEYSVLWNETLLNLSSSTNNGAYVDTRICNSNIGKSKGVCYWSLTNDVKQSDCVFAGSFEYSGLDKRALGGESYTSEYMVKGNIGKAYYDCPNIGGTDRNNPEWGWHRISIRVHQDVTNLDALLADNGGVAGGVPAEYYISSTVYVDGVPISKLGDTDLVTDGDGYDRKLFTATSTGAGGVTYSDVRYVNNADPESGALYVMAYSVNNVDAPTTGKNAYFPVGDTFVTCGQEFVQTVAKVQKPEARTETIDGISIVAPFYYTTYGEHVHTWDGDFVDVQGATLLDHGWSAEHCLICGAMNEETAVIADVKFVPDVQVWTENTQGDYIPQKIHLSGDMLDGGKKFHPYTNYPDGDDLLIEYSILWNPTLLNLDATQNPNITSQIGKAGGANSNDLVYWSPADNVSGAWCKYAGGFEAGHAVSIDSTTPVGGYTNTNYPNMGTDPGEGDFGFAGYPNIGGSDQANPEWGWHRVGIRVHEDVTNMTAVKSGSEHPTYRVTVTTYIDGVAVSELYKQGQAGSLFSTTKDGSNNIKDSGNLLYSAKKGSSGYTNVNSERYVYPFILHSTKAKTGETVYFAIADVYATCGKEFVQPVEKVATPAASTLTVAPGVEISDKMYYKSAAVVKAFNTSSSGIYGEKLNIRRDIQKDDHFYPDPVNNYTGNDLLVEYSILWNDTMLSFRGNSSSYRPSIQTRLCAADTTNDNGAVFWSTVANQNGSDCKYAGGFEYGGLRTSEAGNPYPKMTLTVWDAENEEYVTGDQYSDFPNIGGTNQASPEYGWHRVSVRLRQVVYNENMLKEDVTPGATAAVYKVTCWIYIDGVLVSILSDTGNTNWNTNNRLFTAESDGNGGIIYTDIAYSRWIFPFYLNSTRTSSGTAYVAIKDVSATCGKKFVMEVERANPVVPVAINPANGVGTYYFQLAD